MKIIYLFLIFLSSTTFSQEYSDLKMMSEEFPPYNYSLNGFPSGFASEVLNLLLKNENLDLHKFKVSFLPWSESYKILENEKNSMLYVMTKNTSREKLFKWVGPISKANNGLIALHGQKLENLDHKFICSVFEDAGGQMFLEKYPKLKNQLIVVQFPDQCIYMLNAKRVDFFAYDLNVFNFLAKKLSIDEKQFVMIQSFSEAFHYFAFNKLTNDSLIKKWQKNLEEVKKSKEFKLIQEKYKME